MSVPNPFKGFTEEAVTEAVTGCAKAVLLLCLWAFGAGIALTLLIQLLLS